MVLVVFSVDCLLNVAYLGPNGTYSYAALRRVFPYSKPIAFCSISEVVCSVFNGRVNYGVVPLSNVREGRIEESQRALEKYKVKIIDEITLPIVHCLGALKERGEITSILSKNNIFNQCKEYLDKYYPKAERVFTSSSATACEKVVSERLVCSGAIASEKTLKESGLEIITKDLVPENFSTFVVIARE